MEQKRKGLDNPNSMLKQRNQLQDPIAKSIQQQPQPQKCPRCESINTKFCYYNNYSLSQPRYFCKTCRRYWTQGGTLRNIPVGGGCRRREKRPKIASSLSPTETPSFHTRQAQPHHMISSSNASDPVLTVEEGGDDLLKSYCDSSSSECFLSSFPASIHRQPMDHMGGLEMAPTSIQTLSPTVDFDLAEAESLIQGLLQDHLKVSLSPSLLHINEDHQQQQQFYQNETTSKAVGDSLMFESCKTANSNTSHNDQEQTIWTESFINSMTIKNASACVSSGNSDTNVNNSTTAGLSSSDRDQLSGNYNLPGYGPF